MASDPTTAAEAPPVPPFTTFLAEQGRGELLRELTDEMSKLVAACAELGKGGTLTLTLAVKPTETGTLEIADSVRAKLPTPKAKPSLWFADQRGGLHRRDPRQMEMSSLREVPAPARAAGE